MVCTGVESFELYPDSVDFVVVDGVMYDKTMYSLLYYPASLTAETFVIPSEVHEIGVGAFAGAQMKHITIPDHIYEIPAYAFQDSALESITFHKALRSIGDYAFENCVKLNNVYLFNSVQYAGNYAFANCTSLSAFTFEDVAENGTPYTIGQHFFDGCTAMTSVVLPNYMKITDEEYSNYPWIYYQDRTIPSYMFANSGIVHAVIPARYIDLGTRCVFYGCANMESVTFEAKQLECEYIGAGFFFGCSKLKEVTIPSGCYFPLYDSTMVVEPGKVGGYVFGNCTSLEKVTIYHDMGSINPGS